MTAPFGLVASTVRVGTLTTGGVTSVTETLIVSTKFGPPGWPFNRNWTWHVIVVPCGAPAETEIDSERRRPRHWSGSGWEESG